MEQNQKKRLKKVKDVWVLNRDFYWNQTVLNLDGVNWRKVKDLFDALDELTQGHFPNNDSGQG